MLKHGRAGVPMEVMGLMLGEFVDEYTVQVIDVFAMPQSGTTVSVESVDHVFQTKMVEMLKQTGRCVFLSHLWFAALLIFALDQKWSLAGIIHIQVLGAGFQVLMSRRNRFAFSFLTSLESDRRTVVRIARSPLGRCGR
jgi:JAB1/Mov34/MPN/PAD-1 ubiquitin protease